MDPCQESDFFGFEAGMEHALEAMPMSVRLKLDLCGRKISLAQWRGLPLAVRQVALEVRCGTAVEIVRARRYFCFIVDAFGLGRLTPVRVDPRAWSARARIPVMVASAMEALGLPCIDATAWAELSDLQRFALIKLARQGHIRNLQLALEEFGLWTRRASPSI